MNAQEIRRTRIQKARTLRGGVNSKSSGNGVIFHKKGCLLFLTITIFLLFFSTSALAAWYNSSWSYRKAITIDSGQIPSDQTNFPVLVSLPADSDLATKALSDGNDIFFTSSNGTTKLSHEIEKYTSSTGEIVAHVKIPSLSSSTDTTIYLYYGNSSVTDQQDTNNVWDSNHVMVQHLNEKTMNPRNDSTANDNDGTPYGSGSGSSLNFNGTSDYVWISGMASTGNSWTFSAWAKADFTDSSWHELWEGGNSRVTISVYNNKFMIYDTGYRYSTFTLSDNNWHHYVVTQASGSISFYVDGTAYGTASGATTSLPNSDGNARIGAYWDGWSEFWDGPIDEVRVYSRVLSASEIQQLYRGTEPSSTGLVGLWHMDEATGSTAADSSGQGNNGTITGAAWSTATPLNDATGKINGADEFNGSDDYVDCGNIYTVGTNDVSVEFWFKWPGQTASQLHPISDYDTTAGGWDIKSLSSGKLEAFTNIDGGHTLSTTNTFDDNQWHHFIWTRDGADWRVYVDGILENNETETAGDIPSANDLWIGALGFSNSPNQFFNGSLDSVRISNKVRSADWISTEYNNQSDPEVFYSLGAEEVESDTALSSWLYRKKISIDHSQVSADLNDFPVLVNLPADADLAARARSDGNDIIFVPSTIAWSSGTSNDRYCYEIEKFTSSTGELVAWVKIPSLSSSADTNIYLYYGNASQSTGLENKCTWDSHFKMVQHLNETTGTHYDSTSHGNDGSPTGLTQDATGKINGADEFDGSGYVGISSLHNTNFPQDEGTIEFWIDANFTSQSQKAILDGYSSSRNHIFIRTYNPSNNIQIMAQSPTGGYVAGTAQPIPDNQWNHVVVTYHTGTGAFKIYFNAVTKYSGTISESDWKPNQQQIYLGNGFTGSIDSLRVSNSARSADWISTEYNNQNDPEAFYSLGTEEHYSSTALSSWSYRRKITIDSSQVDADLTDFPVLVNLPNDLDLTSDARSDANDIIFVPSSITWSSGTSNDIYCFEIEKFDGNTGELVAWVKIPSLSSSTDTEFYMYYGNSSQTSGLENKCTWDSHYKMVQHLSESPANSVAGHYDSTPYGNDGTPYNFDSNADSTTDSTGKVDGADLFDGDDAHVDCGTSFTLDNKFSIEVWFKVESFSYSGPWGRLWSYPRAICNNSNLIAVQMKNTAGESQDSGSIYSLSTNQWYHHVFLYNNDTKEMIQYLNGTHRTTNTLSGEASSDSGTFYIGHNQWHFDGFVDELRISDTNRSSDWISTSYNNQSDPEAFYSLGTEQNYSSTALSNWSYRKKITIDSNQISADLTDFPVLINFSSDSGLAGNARSDANDIIFVPSSVTWSAGTTWDRYCHEIEDYNNSTGELVAWVKIPSLSSSTDTEIYLYYGNASQSTGLENKCTWDSHFKMVQHLNEKTMDTRYDSTANNNDGTPYGSGSGSSLDFDGSGDYVNVGNDASLNISGSISVELWFSTRGVTNNTVLISKVDEPNSLLSWDIELAGGAPRTIYWMLGNTDGVGWAVQLGSGVSPNIGEWYHVVGVYDQDAGKAYVYVNGELENQTNYSGDLNTNGVEVWIGARTNPGFYFDGNIDEVRVYSRALSATEVQEHYQGTFSDESNLVGLWHLDEATGSTAADSSGQGNNGTIVNATWSTTSPLNDATGQINGADEFNAVDDYVQVADDNSLGFGTEDFSVEFWFKGSEVSTWRWLLIKGGYGDNAIVIATNVNKFRVSLGSWFTDVISSPPTTIQDDVWYHAVLTRSGTDVKLFLNAAQEGNTGTSSASITNSSSLYIGAGPNISNDLFDGLIDEIRISDTARSADWISTSYNNMNSPSTFCSLGGESGLSSVELAGWFYRKKISIDHSKVEADLENFPVLVHLSSDSDLASRARSDGNDIIFAPATASWSTGTTDDMYCFEIEDYNSSTGELVAWVKIPSLSSSTDTNFYLYYGNASQTTGLENSCTWDENYVMVQHLEESPANDVAGHYDSTSNSNDGTPKNFDGTSSSTTDGTGKIDGADVFDGSDDKVYCSDATCSNLDIGSGGFSVSFWVSTTDSGDNRQVINKGNTSDWSWFFNWNNSGVGVNKMHWALAQAAGSAYIGTVSTSTLNDGGWHHITGTWNPTGTTLKIYVDGSLEDTSTTTSGTLNTDSAGDFTIGYRQDSYHPFTGSIDSIRISDKARDENWILTSYNNQSSPATFCLLESEEELGWVHVVLTYSTANGLKLYVNGELEDSNAANGSIATNDVNVVVGQGYDGRIEELKVFADELSVGEIVGDYNSWMSGSFTSAVFDSSLVSTWTNLGWSESTESRFSRVRLRVRACSEVDCSGSSFSGLSGVGSFFNDYSENDLNALRGQYFQFRAFLDSNSVDWLPVLQELAVDYNQYHSVGYFVSENFTVANKSAWTGVVLTGSTPDGTGTYFQTSTDDGVTWKYWNGSNWVEAGEEFNELSVLNANIGGLTGNSLKFKVKLTSDGSYTPVLESITIQYEAVEE